MTNSSFIQNDILQQLRKNKSQISIFTTNGFQVRGVIKGFDNYTVIVDTGDGRNMIYKHAISTIAFDKNVVLPKVPAASAVEDSEGDEGES